MRYSCTFIANESVGWVKHFLNLWLSWCNNHLNNNCLFDAYKFLRKEKDLKTSVNADNFVANFGRVQYLIIFES